MFLSQELSLKVAGLTISTALIEALLLQGLVQGKSQGIFKGSNRNYQDLSRDFFSTHPSMPRVKLTRLGLQHPCKITKETFKP